MGGNQNESSMTSDKYSAVCIKRAQGRVQVLVDTTIIKLGLHKEVAFS
jgi:hypothetical protein